MTCRLVVVALLCLSPLRVAADLPYDPRVGLAGGTIDALAVVANTSHPDARWWNQMVRLISDSIGIQHAPLPPPPPQAKADPVNGSLETLPVTLVGREPACFLGVSVAFHPNPRFVYTATNAGAFGNVCAFDFGADGKTLSEVPGSPFRAGIGTSSVTIHPSGKFLYASNYDDGTLAGFAIAQNGALTPLAGSPYAAGPSLRWVVADPTGRFVYVASQTSPGAIRGFAVDRDTGALAPIADSPFPAGNNPIALAIDPRGKFLYSTGNPNRAHAIDAATGRLTALAGTFEPFASALAVDPSGRYVFATSSNLTNLLTGYRIGATGTLTAVGPGVPTGDTPIGVTVSRSGRYVYTANLIDSNISGFRIADATGVPTRIETSPFPADANTFAVTTSGGLGTSETWNAGEPLVRPFAVAGGKPPYAWSIASGTLPPGVALVADIGALAGTATAPGDYAFTASVTDTAGDVATHAYTVKVQDEVSLPAFATVVEYYHAGLDHYFITWLAGEIAALDAGTVIKGWTRTSRTFSAWISVQPGSSAICRYYIPPQLGDSHFFGRGTTECNATGAANPSFVLEEPAFMHMVLPTAGTCPAGTTPVYRVFSNRADANHRYMTDRALRDEMVARGWFAEGDGPDLVVMCAP